MATILLEMLSRKSKYILPEDVAAAVLSQGAAATREELVRLMAEEWGGIRSPDGRAYVQDWPRWCQLAWTLEEQARTEATTRCNTYGPQPLPESNAKRDIQRES